MWVKYYDSLVEKFRGIFRDLQFRINKLRRINEPKLLKNNNMHGYGIDSGDVKILLKLDLWAGG